MILLTTAEAAEQLKLSYSHLRKMVSKGEVPVIRLGRAVRISQSDLDKWLRTKRAK